MKIVLMVAAGIAVGGTVALAVVVQVVAALLQALERLTPLLVALALVVLVLHVARRRRGGQGHRDQTFPLPALPPAVLSVSAPALPGVDDDREAPYLRWGPPMHEDPDAPPATYGARRHVSRTRGAHPSGPARGRRP